MAKRVEYHRLPDGTLTTDARKMIREWRKLYRPIMKKLGWHVIGFDPGVLFSVGKNETLSLSVHVCRTLNKSWES